MRAGVVIWPDRDTAKEVDRLRARYDAHYELVGPHITIAFPDHYRSSLDEIEALVAKSAHEVQPFTATLNKWVSATMMLQSHGEQTRLLIERYPNAVNFFFLLVGIGKTEMLTLRRSLSQAIAQPQWILDYPPYMTIGQSLSDEEYASAKAMLADYSPDFSFQVTSIDLLVEQEDGSWPTVATFALGE